MRRFVLLLFALALCLALLAGCTKTPAPPQPPEPAPPPEPVISVAVSGAELPYAVGLIEWDGAVYDRVDTWGIYSGEHGLTAIPSVSLGDTVDITFPESQPDQVQLQAFVLDDSARPLAEYGGVGVEIVFAGGEGSFVLNAELESAMQLAATAQVEAEGAEPGDDAALALESGPVLPAAASDSLRGFMLVCNWGDNYCEFVFVVNLSQ